MSRCPSERRVLTLPYTICFCQRGALILMLHRRYPPFAGLWNGLGGRIEPGEAPLASVQREVLEEAAIDLAASRIRFGGIVTWVSHDVPPSFSSGGMYAFLAAFPPAWPIWEDTRPGPEGELRWWPLMWVCDATNDRVVANVPHFLPALLDGSAPHEYRCSYQDGRLVSVEIRPLPQGWQGGYEDQPALEECNNER